MSEKDNKVIALIKRLDSERATIIHTAIGNVYGEYGDNYLGFEFKNLDSLFIEMDDNYKIINMGKKITCNPYNKVTCNTYKLTLRELVNENGKLYFGSEADVDRIVQNEIEQNDRGIRSNMVIINGLLQSEDYNTMNNRQGYSYD